MAPQKRIPALPPPLTPEDEILLWENKHLNLETSVGIIHAVIFYLIKCFGVCHGRYLKLLTTENVKYGEDDLGKYVTIDLTSAAKFGKVIRRYEDPQNPRSFYKIITTYQRHMTNEGPLLVRPISSIKDYVCYSPWQCGINMIDQIAQILMKELNSLNPYTNSSISMLSIDVLKNLGLGFHCMGTWRQNMFSCHRKDYYRLSDDYDPCNMLNCEKKNLSLCLLVSRLLDPPYPSDIVVLASERKTLLSELEKGKLDLQEVFKDLVIHFSDDNADIYRMEAMNETSSLKRPSSSLVFIKECSTTVQRKKPSKKKSRAGSERQRTGRKRRRSSTPAGDLSAKVNSASGQAGNTFKILAVASISESSFSVQTDEGDKKSSPIMGGVVKIEETSEGKQITLKNNIKVEAMDDSDDLPVTFIKKEIKEEDCSSLDGLSVGFDNGEDERFGNTKIGCDLVKQNIADNSDTCSQEDCMIIDDLLEETTEPSPPVDSLHLLRKLLEHNVIPSEEKPTCRDGAGAILLNSDLSPSILSTQPKANEEIDNSSFCILDMSQQGTGQQQAVTSLPSKDSSHQVEQEVQRNSVSVESNKTTEPSITDLDGESQHFALSKFPPAQSMTNSTSIDKNFPTLRLALESGACYQLPQLVNVGHDQPAHTVLPNKLSSHTKTWRTLRALKRHRSFGCSIRHLTNFKRRHKLKVRATTSLRSNARHLPLPNGQRSNSAHNYISDGSNLAHSSNATLLNSSLAELQPHSGLYHMRSDQEKQATYQTVKIRTDCGTKLFTVGDLQMEKTSSSVVLTSETNIGDYFPEGTMIPANGLKLLTRNGSNGLEVLLKFDYINNSSNVNNSK